MRIAVYLPGSRLISSTSSLTVFAGTDGCTTSTFGDVAMRVTATKSLNGS